MSTNMIPGLLIAWDKKWENWWITSLKKYISGVAFSGCKAIFLRQERVGFLRERIFI